MDDPIDQVQISGSTLSLILRELVTSRRDFDGLLFGCLVTRSIPNFQDDGGDAPAAAGSREERIAIITGCCCSGTVMSFYDAAGRVDDWKIDRLAGDRFKWGGDPVIGWMVVRRGCSMRPSMREAAVSANLAAEKKNAAAAAAAPLMNHQSNHLVSMSTSSMTSSTSSGGGDADGKINQRVLARDQLRPLLFLLFTETVASSIRTQDYRAFQFQSRSRGFQPRSVVVRNVGRVLNPGGQYEGYVAASALPRMTTSFGGGGGGDEDGFESWKGGGGKDRASSVLSSATSCSSPPSSLLHDKQQALLDVYADGCSIDQLQNIARGGGDVEEFELLYSKMLSRMQQLSQDRRRSSEALQAKKMNNSKLKERLGR